MSRLAKQLEIDLGDIGEQLHKVSIKARYPYQVKSKGLGARVIDGDEGVASLLKSSMDAIQTLVQEGLISEVLGNLG